MNELETTRKRRIRRIAAALVAACLLLAWQVAIAQPPGAPKGAAPKAQPAAPKGAQGKAANKLPTGHPPVDPNMDPKRREQLRQLLEQRRKGREGQKADPRRGQRPAQPVVPPKPKKPKAPRDEHGHCLGQGPDDRPKDINLFHGWLGSKHDLGDSSESWSKAVKPPSPKGSKEWWYWRLTPYPYRYDNHEDHCDAANQPIPLFANIINLAAMAFIIVRFGGKPIAEALKSRKRTIMTEFDKAADIKRSARERLDEYEDDLDNLDTRLGSLREQYAAEGRHEAARVREESQSARARMLADAAFRVSQEGKTTRDELSREALEGALTAAEELIHKTLTKADHDRIAAEYLDQVGPALKAVATGDGRGDAS